MGVASKSMICFWFLSVIWRNEDGYLCHLSLAQMKRDFLRAMACHGSSRLCVQNMSLSKYLWHPSTNQLFFLNFFGRHKVCTHFPCTFDCGTCCLQTHHLVQGMLGRLRTRAHTSTAFLAWTEQVLFLATSVSRWYSFASDQMTAISVVLLDVCLTSSLS